MVHSYRDTPIVLDLLCSNSVYDTVRCPKYNCIRLQNVVALTIRYRLAYMGFSVYWNVSFGLQRLSCILGCVSWPPKLIVFIGMRQLASKVDRVYWDASVGLQSWSVFIGMCQLAAKVNRCLSGCVSWLPKLIGVYWDASIGLQSWSCLLGCVSWSPKLIVFIGMRQLASKVDWCLLECVSWFLMWIGVYWDASVGLVFIGMRQLASKVDRCLLGCVSCPPKWTGVYLDRCLFGKIPFDLTPIFTFWLAVNNAMSANQ